MNRLLRIIVPFALLGLALATRQFTAPPAEISPALSPVASVPSGFVMVTRVVDGDTIEVSSGQKVRYIGVNTPETVHPSKPVECFGHEASVFNTNLVGGKAVRLVKDISETDKYGRLLRYVYLEDGTFVNLALVSGGFAQVNTYPPDVAHAAEFQAAQADARAAGRGLWSSCK